MDAIKGRFGNIVDIFEPTGTPVGITVLLPGTRINLSQYESTKAVLLGLNQLVLGYRGINPFIRSHNGMAEDVRDIVAFVQELDRFQALSGVKYNIVGHSLGAKVALLVAAKFDVEKVAAVIALDPVDDKPREIIPGDTPLTPAMAQIHLTRAEEGGNRQALFPPQSPEKNSATAIREAYPDKEMSFALHEGAGHMAYTDSGNGGNYLFGGGTRFANDAARASAHKLIQKEIGKVKIPTAEISPRGVAEGFFAYA